MDQFEVDQVLIIVGNYGSGKTEVAVNLAVERKAAGIPVAIADLDLVNPYFRTREARGILRQLGVEVVLPHERYMAADLPILSSDVAAAIRRRGSLVIIDAGGDDAGATVLASLAGALDTKPIKTLQIINPMRPYSEDLDACSRMREKIEGASRLAVNGIVGNANLMDETTAEHIYQGYRFVKELAQAWRLPLEFVTAPVPLLADLERRDFACPLLAIRRQLVPPWRKPTALNVNDQMRPQ